MLLLKAAMSTVNALHSISREELKTQMQVYSELIGAVFLPAPGFGTPTPLRAILCQHRAVCCKARRLQSLLSHPGDCSRLDAVHC